MVGGLVCAVFSPPKASASNTSQPSNALFLRSSGPALPRKLRNPRVGVPPNGGSVDPPPPHLIPCLPPPPRLNGGLDPRRGGSDLSSPCAEKFNAQSAGNFLDLDKGPKKVRFHTHFLKENRCQKKIHQMFHLFQCKEPERFGRVLGSTFNKGGRRGVPKAPSIRGTDK